MTDAELLSSPLLSTSTVIAAEAEVLSLVSLETDHDPGHLVAALRLIREARGRLSDAERAFEKQLAESMPSKVSADNSYEKHWAASSTKWDSDYILPRIASASRDERIMDTETGEIEGEAEAAMRCFREAAGIGYFRVGALKRLGINVDDCREKTGGRWVIKFNV